MDDETIRILINKIENGLADIKLRSIATLYSKISVGIIDPSILSKFINLPGVLLQWINDNRSRSEPLFKVLTILSYFMKTQEGLVIMTQYQALQFFQQYRRFLLEQQPRHDQYTTLLENLSKLLTPLQTSTNKSISHIDAQSSICTKYEQPPKTKEVKQKQKTVKIAKEGIKMGWIVARQPLGKKEQDQLYALMMELRHSKRDLQLQWLKKIQSLVKYWGYKSFRFRVQLINQLTEQFSKASFKWLIIDILKAIVIGIGQNSRQLSNQQLNLISLAGNEKYIRRPQTQKISILFKKELFDSIYSCELIEELIKYDATARQSDLYDCLLEMRYKYSSKYFRQSFQKKVERKEMEFNIQLLNQNIQYYCSNFDWFPEEMSHLLSQAPKQWNLSPQKFPFLKNYLQNLQKNKKITYISKYKEDWLFGNNLHNVAEVIDNLQLGVDAIDARNHKQYIRIYLNSLLTLGVAVQKQDPLMSYYPTIKGLIIKIAKKPVLRNFLFEQILNAVNSNNPIKYGSKKFSESDLGVLIFSEQTMFKSMFYESFGDESSLESWLQIIFVLVKKSKDFCEFSSYACIFFSLTYHKNEKIKHLSKNLIEGLSKKGKQIITYCKLFSISEEERLKTCKDVFRENNGVIFPQIQQHVIKNTTNKKLLKISQNSIQNYIQIIFNSNIEEEIRLNAAKELLESVQRIQLTANLQQLLLLLSENIVKSLNEHTSIPHSFLSLFIQLNNALNQILEQKYYLKVDNIISLLQISLPSKVFQILLQQLYIYCFQNPFSSAKEAHFITLLYPHINFVQMKISGKLQTKQQVFFSTEEIPGKNKLVLPNYEESLQFSHFIQWAIYAKLNNISIKLTQTFVNIVEKEIGSVLHANKGYNELHYLAYGFTFLSKKNLQLPDKILDYSSPLLGSLLAKDQSPFNCDPIAVIIAIIGCKKSRQLHSLLASNPVGMWKYFILFQMQAIQPNLMQLIIKTLIGINYGKQAVLILRLYMMQASKCKINEFSQSLILSSCIKFVRQETDRLLRKTAICLLTQIYETQALSCQGYDDIFSSMATLLFDQTLSVSQMNLLLNLIKTIIHKNKGTIQEINLFKMVIQKIAELIMIPSIIQLTGTIIYEIISLVAMVKPQLLTKFELVDSSISFISNICQKNQKLNELNIKFITSILDYLFLQSNIDENLSKYLLTSTNLLKNMVKICSHQQDTIFSKQLFESLGRITINISNMEQDLFLYKLNQIIKNETKSLPFILSINIKYGGLQYLRMIGWLMVIWLRNRQELDPQLGSQFAQIALNSEKPIIIKSILPFSIQAKILFLQSKYLQQLLKQNSVTIDNRLVKQIKDKKKKNKVYQLQAKQKQHLQFFLSILSSLFYSDQLLSKLEIKQCEGLKRILIFIQKMYSCGHWDQQVTKSYVKVVTNMALSQPFANACSNRLSENAVMIQQMIGCILKSQNSQGLVKLSLKIIGVLVHLEPIRSIVLRAKVTQQLSMKLIKGQQSGDINLEYIMDIIEVFISLSAYKDSNIRIFNDKRTLEVLLRIIKLGKFSILEEKIVTLLSNLACFKSNKSIFMSNRDIHKIILGLLQDRQVSYHSTLLSLLYNLLYKNSAALKLYRRNDVIQVIKNVSSDDKNDVNAALLQALMYQQSAC